MVTVMNLEIKNLWVAALRSDDYVQGRLALCKDNKFCCLGVLCELAAEAGICSKEEKQSYVLYDGDRSLLPRSVRDWAGLATISPDAPDGKKLVSLNDEGTPFREIADLIEAYL